MKSTNLKDNMLRNIQSEKGQIRVMVVANRHGLRTEVVGLIKSESSLEVCVEAENVKDVLQIFEENQIDFMIICTFQGDTKSKQLINEVKFGCPNLPVLMLSMPAELLFSGISLRKKTECIINQKMAKQIIDAIHYVENLLKNNILGFAVLVNIEMNKASHGVDNRSLTNRRKE